MKQDNDKKQSQLNDGVFTQQASFNGEALCDEENTVSVCENDGFSCKNEEPACDFTTNGGRNSQSDGVSSSEGETSSCEENTHNDGKSVVVKGSLGKRIVDKAIWVICILLSVICVFLIYGRVVYGDPYTVVGDSMTCTNINVVTGLPDVTTYVAGKYVYIDADVGYQRGDVIIVDDAENDQHPLIKRVIALEGDKIWLENGFICVLEAGKSESYVIDTVEDIKLSPISIYTAGNLRETTKSNPYTVPEGCIYYVGDNRNNSSDCRDTGAVSASLVRGKVMGIIPDWYAFILDVKQSGK